MVGIRHDSNGVAISNALKKKLELGLSILLMYCKKDDPNTYYELIWELNDSKYSAEILMAYFTRVYHYAAIQPFTPGRNSKESEDAIIKALKSARANICSRGSPGDGKIILYTLQGLPTGPM
ncbi:hypothetical protein IWQ62_000612 [Dispira parvispora]|uniref:Uncharacterized protein n=1 Tax=Dispira parvispora TaxID=1520584 RepID=A0A9W8AUF5_9FUNG|nr:hypothetical protein IWQ62_000612 [Dispira parvispora]